MASSMLVSYRSSHKSLNVVLWVECLSGIKALPPFSTVIWKLGKVGGFIQKSLRSCFKTFLNFRKGFPVWRAPSDNTPWIEMCGMQCFSHICQSLSAPTSKICRCWKCLKSNCFSLAYPVWLQSYFVPNTTWLLLNSFKK